MAKDKEVESFTSSDMQPFPPANDLAAKSFEELEAESQIHVADVDDFALANKDDLVGEKMFILDWNFKEGDFGSDYVTVTCRTQYGLQFFTDGSKNGVKKQLRDYQDNMEKEGTWEDFKAGKLGGMRVPRGLRVSNYTFKNSEGEDTPGTTYYIDNKDR